MKTRRNIIGSLVRLILSALLTGFALFLMMQGFGWFSTKRIVTAASGGIHNKSIENIEILAKADGENIGVTVPDEYMQKLPIGKETTTLRPNMSGSFSFFVHDGSVGETNAYSFKYGVRVENNQFHKGDSFSEGYYPNTDPEAQVKAKDFINSHLLFFTNYENGVYSGWISPGYSVSCDVSPESDTSPYKVTVYWVWIAWYNQIFDENSGLIEEKTRKMIADYYSDKVNLTKMFNDGIKSTEAYNMADTLIGVTLKYICFQVDVSRG